MKLSIAVIFLFICFANSHVLFSPWERTQLICQRPATGTCSKAGSCCGKTAGTFDMTRNCLHGPCESHMLERTANCRIRCREADADAYGPWVQAGNCERPASGECSEEDTCCGMVKGKMLHTRECFAANGCLPETLERQFRCNVRCGVVHPCQSWPNPCENGGTCAYQGDSHTCKCANGWTGHHCEERVTLDDTTNGDSVDEAVPEMCPGCPCKNGARCVKEDSGQLWRCICMEGYFGRWCDGKLSETPNKLECPDDKFRCFVHDRDICIDRNFICDDFQDCDNNEDESMCRSNTFCCSAAKNDFIQEILRCDGRNDCSNGADEEGCV